MKLPQSILVTGATGFIGTALIQRLIAHGVEVSILVRASTNTDNIPPEVQIFRANDRSDYLAACTQQRYDGIVHLATLFRAKHTPEDVAQLIESNITFGTHLIEAATEAHIPWFLNVGTFAQHCTGEGYAPHNLYAATKQAYRDILQWYGTTHATRIMTLELFDTFGVYDTRRKLMNILCDAARTGVHLPMSPGEQVIDISPVENIVDGFMHAITLLNYAGEEHHLRDYTLPSCERMRLRDLVVYCAEIWNKPIHVQFGGLPYRQHEIMHPIVGTPLPGWKPRISLREALHSLYTHTACIT